MVVVADLVVVVVFVVVVVDAVDVAVAVIVFTTVDPIVSAAVVDTVIDIHDVDSLLLLKNSCLPHLQKGKNSDRRTPTKVYALALAVS